MHPFRVPLHIGRVPVPPPAGLALCLASITQFEAIVHGVRLAQWRSAWACGC